MVTTPRVGWAETALVTVAALVTAAAYVKKEGTQTWTDPSGSTGPTTVQAETTASYYGLQGLKLWQYDGKPCVLEVGQASFNKSGVNWLDKRLKLCEPTVGQEWKQVDVGAGRFITSIAVCTASKGDETIQGVELSGAGLGEHGEVKAKSSTAKIAFSACKKWQPPRACPKGTLATAIRAFGRTDAPGIIGLSLRCQAVEERGK